ILFPRCLKLIIAFNYTLSHQRNHLVLIAQIIFA
ncbi:hypothetical protein A2U01_0061205, partial [Trifolium medium]|nr:hypothetical protein [Trifolium medium]